MKNNTQDTKALLQRALTLAPDDHALSEVRFHIRAALGKIENVEKKRERRVVNAERRELAAGQGNVHAFDPFRAIQAIDEEIAREKAKIEEIQRRRNMPKDQKDDDDDGLQTVFG